MGLYSHDMVRPNKKEHVVSEEPFLQGTKESIGLFGCAFHYPGLFKIPVDLRCTNKCDFRISKIAKCFGQEIFFRNKIHVYLRDKFIPMGMLVVPRIIIACFCFCFIGAIRLIISSNAFSRKMVNSILSTQSFCL